MKIMFKAVVVAILTWEARQVLAKFKPKIIAITGNVGKTGTKDAIHTTLQGLNLYIRKNKKSLNSEIGVPLTILGEESAWSNPLKWLAVFTRGARLILFKKKYPEWLVLEVGTDKPGDIQAITKWLHPDVVVITALPSTPVHISNFDTVEDIVQEKLALARALKPDGVLVLNGSDPKIRNVSREFTQRKVFYGTNQKGEIVYANNVPTGMSFTVTTERGVEPIFLHGIIGQQWLYLILASLAVCEALGLNKHEAALALAYYEPAPGRMRILSGIGQTIIIDDSYNSSPLAMAAALDAFGELQVSGRKIAVLGDMRELGEHSAVEHRVAGEHVAQVADILITIGEESRVLAQAALDAGMPSERITEFGYYDSARAGQKVRGMLQKGDVVLVKGSQNKIRTERVVKAIMAEPERASELLVRQEKEWLSRK